MRKKLAITIINCAIILGIGTFYAFGQDKHSNLKTRESQ